MKDLWLAAQNLSVGDVVLLNWEYVFEIKRVARNDSEIDYMGKLRYGNDKWRVLRVGTGQFGALGLYTPSNDSRVGIVGLSPIDGTILASKTADALLSHDVTGEETYDTYVDKRESEVDFPPGATIVGQCFCDGDIAKVEAKAICESCGRWVPIEVWNEWSTANSGETYDDSPSKSNNEGDSSGNRSIGDFM